MSPRKPIPPGQRHLSPLQRFASDLLEKPVDYPAPFPTELSEKSLMDLLTNHLKKEEIDDAIIAIRADKRNPGRAAEADYLHDMLAGMEEGTHNVSAEDQKAIADLVREADGHRIFPVLKKKLEILAHNKKSRGRPADRFDILDAELSLKEWLPFARERLHTIFENAQFRLHTPQEFNQLVDNLSKGLEGFLHAGIWPSSAKQVLEVGKNTSRSAEEEIEILAKEVITHNHARAVEKIAAEAIKELGKLVELLTKEAAHGKLRL